MLIVFTFTLAGLTVKLCPCAIQGLFMKILPVWTGFCYNLKDSFCFRDFGPFAITYQFDNNITQATTRSWFFYSMRLRDAFKSYFVLLWFEYIVVNNILQKQIGVFILFLQEFRKFLNNFLLNNVPYHLD